MNREREERFWESRRREVKEMALDSCLFVGPIGATPCRRYWVKIVAAIDMENPNRWIMIESCG
ncbi:hypothetical protein Hanom_Chr16g01447741 [Helianthus anomalus]